MERMNANLMDVCAAYRLLLERNPDADGLLHYADKISRGLSVGALRSMFLGAGEFHDVRKSKIAPVKMYKDVVVVVDADEPEFGHTIAIHHSWEPHIVDLIRGHLAPGSVYVDVGANVGVMAFNAADVVGPSGKIIAFEPDTQNAARFLAGLKESALKNVLLYPFALSDRQEIRSLAGGSNAYLIGSQDSTRLVQAVRGDDLLAGEQRIDFIKLDVEGHEPFVLKGLSSTLRKHKPLVLCEYNPRCLTSHFSISPSSFAAMVFELTTAVEAIEHNGSRNSVSRSDDLLELWSTKNDDAVRSGFLPEGMLHFDLLFKVGKDE
jgi:FkbM family methyltransferase